MRSSHRLACPVFATELLLRRLFSLLSDLRIASAEFLSHDLNSALARPEHGRLGKLHRSLDRSRRAPHLATTLFFVVITIPLELGIGLGIALVINEVFRGRGLLRAVVLIPWAIPTVVASQMWRFIFNDRYGLFNFMLFGGDTSRYLAPLADPYLAPWRSWSRRFGRLRPLSR